MLFKPKEKTIDEIFAEGTLIDLALKQAVQEALWRHKQAGNPVVAWRNGKIVWIPPKEITVLEKDTAAL
jgi:hypothetical protein